MTRKILLTSVFAIGLAFLAHGVHAAEISRVSVTRTCGAYRYDVRRIVDGFSIQVTDGSRVRSIFYEDLLERNDVYGSDTVLSSECSGSSLVFIDRRGGKYYYGLFVRLLDPTQDELRIVSLGAYESRVYGDTGITPLSASAEVERFLSVNEYGYLEVKSSEDITVTKAELVSKKRIAAEKTDALNDRSYYVFSGSCSMVKKIAPSFWNTTFAEDVVVCDKTSYTLYAKKFGDQKDSVSLVYPPTQYIVERWQDGIRTLIPVPHEDGKWDQLSRINFGKCFGKNASLFIFNSITWQDRVSIISSRTPFVDYANLQTSMLGILENNQYYEPGYLWRDERGIQGKARMRTLNADGTVTERKPVFFRSLASFPIGSSMRFMKDSREPEKVLVILDALRADSVHDQSETTYWLETDGVYQQVERSGEELDQYAYRNLHSQVEMTDLYVAPDGNNLVVKSFFLDRPMFLHGFPYSGYTLLWQRVGPLEKDGTRKIWYAFDLHGVKETWMAVVR